MTDHLDDVEFAGRIAHEAGQLLLSVYRDGVAAGLDGKALKDKGDHDSNVFLLERLAAERPNDAVLSEESADDLARLDAERVWIIDPVDGTREYSEGRTDWAVHVALVVGGAPVAAAVALPGLGEVLTSAPAGASLAPAHDGPIRLVVSRTRPPKLAEYLAEVLGAELVGMGSAGAKAMSVLRGESDVYAHAGGQYQWDNCAPAGVALAAGAHCTRLDGSPLVYNDADLKLPDLLVCRPELAEQVLAAIAAAPPGLFETA
jgi:3'(2'), 5'-bisphosphate nucleotidase